MTAMPDLSMESNRRLAMTENKQTIERYMEGFRRGDHAMILSCLTDDVEWVIPGAFLLVGKDAYDREIENPAYVGRPAITITRVTEENNVVVAEGSVLTQRKEGSLLRLAFCDVFEMERGKIKRLISYLVEITAA